MALKIDNDTNWDGRDLRRLCKVVIEHTDGYTSRYGNGVVDRVIEIKTSKSQGKEHMWEAAAEADGSAVGTARRMYRGRASIGSRRRLYMGVPMAEREVDGEWRRHEFDPVQFARVLEHEILHNQGLRHGDYADDVRYCRQEIDYADELPAVSPKPSFESRVEN